MALTMVLAFLAKVGSGLDLTPMNYESSTAGKTVFIVLHKPSCGHCRNMEAAWKKLTADYAGHEKYLVASIDCSTKMGRIWCLESFGLKGYPTLLYGSPEHHGALLQEYEDDRSYEELAEFAKEVFSKPLCSEENLDACTEGMKGKLKALKVIESDSDDSDDSEDPDEDMPMKHRVARAVQLDDSHDPEMQAYMDAPSGYARNYATGSDEL